MVHKLFKPHHFLYKFSLHIGVVTICSMGIMLYIISFFINMFGRDPEFNDTIIMVHWFIVMIFIVVGFSLYVVGMLAAYKESQRLVTITLICLIVHFIVWIFLTGLSFVNNLTINSIVCIDNRCADRLFIKNGNWRRADEEYCNNPSRLRGVLLGDIDITEEEGPEAAGSQDKDENSDNQVAFVDYIYDHNLGSRTPSTLEKHDNLHVRSIMHRSNVKNRNVDIDSRRRRNVSFMYNSSVLRRYRSSIQLRRRVHKPGFRVKVFNDSANTAEVEHKGNDSNNLIRTPIGYVGCNAPQHIAYSVLCALMICCLWYVYPILIFYSYMERLKRRLSQRGS